MSNNPRPADPRKTRQNIILALVHAGLALLMLAAFFYIQTRK